MITVNIGKVSLIKTHTSNSADAGALAAGSAMASIFNSLAVANQQLIDMTEAFRIALDYQYRKAYRYFYKSIENSVYANVLAGATLGVMYLSACAAIILLASPATLGALVALAYAYWYFAIRFKVRVKAIRALVEAWYEAMYEAYGNIRESISEAIPSAIQAGHQLSFANANISSKLIEDPEKAVGTSWDKTTDDYENFFDSLGSSGSYTFSWRDGHNRAHSVTSNVSTADVVVYDLGHTEKRSDQLDDQFKWILNLIDAGGILYGLSFNQYLKPINPLPTSINILDAAQNPSNLFSLSNYDVTSIYRGGAGDMRSVYREMLRLDPPPTDPQQWMGDKMGGNMEGQSKRGILIYSCAVEVVATAIAGIGRVVWKAAWYPNAWEMAGKTILWGLIWQAIVLGAINPIIKYLLDWTKDGIRCTKSFTSSSATDVGKRIICWIEEVEHNRKVSVSAVQSHQGRDLTLWQTDYPTVTSRAVSDFRGGGSIYLPSWEHSAVLEQAN